MHACDWPLSFLRTKTFPKMTKINPTFYFSVMNKDTRYAHSLRCALKMGCYWRTKNERKTSRHTFRQDTAKKNFTPDANFIHAMCHQKSTTKTCTEKCIHTSPRVQSKYVPKRKEREYIPNVKEKWRIQNGWTRQKVGIQFVSADTHTGQPEQKMFKKFLCMEHADYLILCSLFLSLDFCSCDQQGNTRGNWVMHHDCQLT